MGTGTPLVRDKDLSLDEFPVYVSSGSILPIHPWDRAVQHSQAQGGLLEVQVYGGADASFQLYEDDGASNDYANSGNFRVTSLVWNDAKGSLMWNVDGGKEYYKGGNDYTEIRVALYSAKKKCVVRSTIKKIGGSGKIVMDTHS